jgi:hypothetical protein
MRSTLKNKLIKGQLKFIDWMMKLNQSNVKRWHWKEIYTKGSKIKNSKLKNEYQHRNKT